MNRNTPRLSIAARRRIVEAVQRIERPMSRRTHGDASRNHAVLAVGNRDLGDMAHARCGHLICSCPPQVTPKPSARALDNLGAEPSPAGGRDPYEAAGHPWARVGMQVRYLESGHSFDRGSILVVADARLDFIPLLSRVWVKRIGDSDSDALHAATEWLEPAPIAEAPAVESDPIAECERLGITFTKVECDDVYAAHGPDRNLLVSAFLDLNKPACARAALEAWSRREPAQ